MPTVTYLTDNKSVESEAGETLLESSLRFGIPHTRVCGGTRTSNKSRYSRSNAHAPCVFP